MQPFNPVPKTSSSLASSFWHLFALLSILQTSITISCEADHILASSFSLQDFPLALYSPIKNIKNWFKSSFYFITAIVLHQQKLLELPANRSKPHHTLLVNLSIEEKLFRFKLQERMSSVNCNRTVFVWIWIKNIHGKTFIIEDHSKHWSRSVEVDYGWSQL